MVRRDLLQNIGVIPNEGMVAVRLKHRTLGNVEEIFLRNLQPGDVFIIAGRAVRLERVGSMECFVSRADSTTPTVPRWNANKMPLTNKVAEEIVKFRTEIRQRLERAPGILPGLRSQGPGKMPGARLSTDLTSWIDERLDCGKTNAEIICRIHSAQHDVSEIPTEEFLLVEELLLSGTEETQLVGESSKKRVQQARQRFTHAARHYFFHTLVGRAANEALSRVVALRLSRLRGGNAVATPDDYGFVLTVTPQQHFATDALPELLSPARFAEDLDESLSRSHLLKYHFRNAAQAGMMVYRNFFGEQKPLRKLQWSTEVIFNVLQQYEPDHVLMREAKRDAVHTYIDIEGAIAFLQTTAAKPMRIKQVHRVPPLSFALFATKIKEALLVEDPRETMERLYHLWWSKIENENTKPQEANTKLQAPSST